MILANAKTKRVAGGVVVVLVAAIAITVYIKKHSFETINPTVSELNVTLFGVGSVEAKEVILLAPKTTAKIGSLYADEGDSVQKGKALALLEPSDLSASKEEAQAGLARSKAQYSVQLAQLDDAKAKEALAQITLERYTNLAKKGFVSQAELDTASAAAKSAKAGLDSATIGVQSTKADIKKSEAVVGTMSARIDDLTLRTPVDSVVISRDAEKGSTVSAGSPVFHLANPKTIWIKAFVDERQSGALKVGQQAVITLRSNEKQKFQGAVSRIGAQSDRVTEEKEVDIAFKAIPSSITIGEQAEVTITTASYPQALTLPRSALVKKDAKNGVWVNIDGRAKFREVSIKGQSLDAKVALSGISKDDKVALHNKRELSEGMRVW